MVTGTEGDDVLINSRIEPGGFIWGLGGNDTITVIPPGVVPFRTSGMVVSVDGGDGIDTLTIKGAFSPDVLFRSLTASGAQITEGSLRANAQTFVSYTAVERLVIFGTAWFTTNDGTPLASGSWTTGSTVDEIHLFGTVGRADILVSTGGGDDKVYVGDVGGGSVIRGGDGDDLLDLSGVKLASVAALGEAGNDILLGSDQSDGLEGGSGDDVMTGGAGDDRLDGGSDVDTASYETAAAPVAVSLALLGTPQVTGGGGIDTLIDVENLVGSAFADLLTGNPFANLLDGRQGADTMVGGNGDDVYYVDDPGDVVEELAGEGTDTVFTSLAAYSLFGTQIERLRAVDDGAHDFRGSAGNDDIVGGAGADFLRLQDGGIDSAAGGGGDDVFLFGAALTAADTVDGGAGTDQVALQGNYVLTFGAGLTSIENLAILPGSDARFGDPGTGFYDYDLTTVDANVAAGAQLTVDAARLRPGEDFAFNGAAETDGSFFIYGGGGTDLLTGGLMNDVFLFGPLGQWGPADTVNGGPGGIDQLALRGEYTIVFGATQLVGIENIGLVSALSTRFAPLGTDYDYDLTMNDGNVAAGVQMTVDGAALASTETLTFDGSAETDGSFRLFGGKGADVLAGSRNADVIVGRQGADSMTGNGGNDVFRYNAVGESTAGAADSILDFTPGSDRIDLGRIDADTLTAGDQAFSFIGASAFSGAAGELRAYQNNGGWLVEGDVDGDGAADLVIQLTLQGATPLGAGDFIL